MNVLVTGGAGYIGSHACKALKMAGHTPIAYDNLSSGKASAVKWGPLVKGDVRNSTELSEAIREFKIDEIIHFAGLISVGESVAKPSEYYDINVVGTKSVLDCMVKTKVQRIVFSSTAAVYGNPVTQRIDENHPKNPLSPYGRSKLMCEQMIEDYSKAYSLKAICLRYFNASGADLDGEIGEEHDPETHLIPLVLRAAIDPKSFVRLFGTNYPTPDGTCVRDYIHVHDLAQAHLKALTHLRSSDFDFDFFNVGTSDGYSVRQVIDMACDITSKEIRLLECDARTGDPAELVASTRKISSTLDWVPMYSSLRKIVETAWHWELGKSRP